MAKTITNIPKDITNLKNGKLDKSANLSDLADRAAAWLNVRPIGSTPLAGDPVDDLDATTKRWVQNKFDNGIANTSWSVINADQSAPAVATVVVGGKVESKYSNPSSSQFARLYSSSSWSSSSYAVVEAEGSSKHAYKFYENGTVDFRQSGKTNPFRMYTNIGTWNGITDATVSNLTTNGMDRVAISSASDTLVRGYSIGGTKPNGYPTKVGYHMYIPGNDAFGIACMVIGGDNGKFCRYFFDIHGQIYGSTDYGNFSYTKNGTSDSRVKHGIAPVGVDKSYSNIKGLEFVEFIYDNDEQNRVRHGVIAQQAEVVEPLYVKTRKYVGNNPGEIVEQKELDTTPMLLDTMHVVQELIKRIESLQEDNKKLKELISNLNNSQTTDLP